MEAFDVEASVQGGPAAASRARRLVEDELSGRVPDEILPDVALLITELVANGVRHGGAGEDAELDLRIEARPPELHVEVVNPDHGHAPVGKRRPDLLGGGGLGLHIVERVASRWGVRERPRITVWFDLDCGADRLH